ncbi:MAG: glutamate ABC transporter substrate-binding protein, partial [[Mycobacterium] stephanolepidis]
REVYGIGLAKGDTAAIEAIDRALDKMIASGTWDADLREALGDSTIDDWEKRATGGTYALRPNPSPAAVEKITGVRPVADKACEAA